MEDDEALFLKNAFRAKILASQGRLSDALKALESSGFATPSEEVLNCLKEKHPFAPRPTILNVNNSPWLIQKESVVANAISFKAGSAAGLDGFYSQYYKDINTLKVSEVLNSFWNSITKFITISLEGKTLVVK